jgi:hypothetical protein
MHRWRTSSWSIVRKQPPPSPRSDLDRLIQQVDHTR